LELFLDTVEEWEVLGQAPLDISMEEDLLEMEEAEEETHQRTIIQLEVLEVMLVQVEIRLMRLALVEEEVHLIPILQRMVEGQGEV